MSYSLLVFDWDGTLMDSTHAISVALQAACQDLDVAIPTINSARHVIGLGWQEAIAYIAPELDLSQHPRFLERYRYHFATAPQKAALFEGVIEMLDALCTTPCFLAIATGKSRAGLDKALNETGIKDCFQATRCADQSFSKPHPAMLQEIMNELGQFPSQTLMIGDTIHDLRMAQNAGTASAAVSYGAHSKEALLDLAPHFCAQNVAELHQWLLTSVT